MSEVVFCTIDGTRWVTETDQAPESLFGQYVWAWPQGTIPKIGGDRWLIRGNHIAWIHVEP